MASALASTLLGAGMIGSSTCARTSSSHTPSPTASRTSARATARTPTGHAAHPPPVGPTGPGSRSRSTSLACAISSPRRGVRSRSHALGVERLAQDRLDLVLALRLRQAERRLGRAHVWREEHLIGDLLVGQPAQVLGPQIAPAGELHLHPDREALPGIRIEVDAPRVVERSAPPVLILAGQDGLDDLLGLVEVVSGSDRDSHFLAVSQLAAIVRGIHDRVQQRAIGVWVSLDELGPHCERAAGMAVPQLLDRKSVV